MTLITTGQATRERTKTTYTKIDDDVIRNIGYSTSEGDDKKMVLLGDKYSYVLNEGIDKVELMTQLNPQYLKLPKTVYVDRITENSIQTHLSFEYKKSDENYSDEEKKLLNRMCNSKKSESWKPKLYYDCDVLLIGELYKTRASDKANYSLQKGRHVEIRQQGEKTYRDYGELMLLPASVAIDVVTLPLQLLWIGAAGIVHATSPD
ncbi:hypothetical protein [Psychrobacter sp. FDAARGOS_221]|uniref:hypothetical protein n=1 Tax=Psychrobacter sp. FDAARGOS_221 TaxID=1975705 RepID=UPI000FDC2EC1|nr:hypothetical protein [Psychrobacter sp. FDAARGOS_221]